MAKLTKVDASRVTGVSRQTLYVYIREGRLSVDPDGRIDTAELLRAGFTLQGLQSADSQPMSENLHELTHRSDTSDTLVDILRDQIQILREELQDARAERQAAREHIAELTAMLRESQQQNQRLLDMPRTLVPPQTAQDGPGATQPQIPEREGGSARTRPSASQPRRRGICGERCADVSWPCSRRIRRA